MTRFMRRGRKQNRIRYIWKSVKRFYQIAEDYNEFTDLCCSFYYSTASSVLDMSKFLKLVKAVGDCR